MKNVSPIKPLRILNVGAATGATTIMLQELGNVVTLEYDEDCCVFLKEKLGIEAVNASLTELPFESDDFDLVCAFDVIEHIKDDEKAVSEIKRVLKPGGHYFLSVPAFEFLWSHHDVVNHHIRRYSKKQLTDLVLKNGLSVTFKSFFNFFLFFPIALIRSAQKLFPRKPAEGSTGSDFEVMSSSKLIDRTLYQVLNLENVLLKLGVRFPVGVSILMIGKKQQENF